MTLPETTSCIIVGAGPAGLTCAYELARNGAAPLVVEALDDVGGISRTVEFEGYRFDLGGHRFFSKSEEIERLWDEIAFEPLLVRPRLSRIFYGGKFYYYPLRPLNALANVGPVTAAAILASYLKARVAPVRPEDTFEAWVSNRFGRRLYEMFFKSYTEKVWGIPCSEISAEWAAQRIKGLSLGEAVRNALRGGRGNTVKTLIEQFRYPALGPGQLWNDCARRATDAGAVIALKTRAVAVRRERGGFTVALEGPTGRSEVRAEHLVSSVPIRDLVAAIDGAPEPVRERARALRYRGFIMVAIAFDEPGLFPDNWVYVHSPEVRLGRVQNFGNWSERMVPDPGASCLGMEYFADPEDALWSMEDADLAELAVREVRAIGLVTRGRPLLHRVVRVPDAYPVYETDHEGFMRPLRDWLGSVPGLWCVGRNGQHRYNNMDHAMMTGLLAARSILDGNKRDVWEVNTDAEYHEQA
ncbi:MAG: NAD(P)/FAD-dependent oxidoreductase [Coriobacteriia bacterium]|nr:NAD(P)/FAD-dependent oxidoreductase [Coriobacteriia bacterium]